MIKIMSSGVFDVLNLGHINILTQAKKIGDYLVVGIQSDESVKKFKGSTPILRTQERIDQVKALPFVDEIVVYDDIDQRGIWSDIKPDVIVQGDDYIHSADRTESIKFLKENNIRLVLLPRTQGISSTEIKKRILIENRKDIEHFKNLKMLAVEDLSVYEEYDRNKVDYLKKKIIQEGCFDRPIAIGITEKFKIVVDGNNRLQALKELGYKFISCICFDYRKIDLTNNIHYKKGEKTVRLSEFSLSDGEEVHFKKYSHSDIIELIKNNQTIPSGHTWHRLPYYIINLKISLTDLNDPIDLDSHINRLISNNEIRFYPNSVYSCSEWGVV